MLEIGHPLLGFYFEWMSVSFRFRKGYVWEVEGGWRGGGPGLSKMNSWCQPKRFRKIFDYLKIMDVPRVGELIRRAPFTMFNNLPNTPLDRPQLEALCIGKCNVQFIVGDIAFQLEGRATIVGGEVEKMMKEMVAAVQIEPNLLAKLRVFYALSAIMFHQHHGQNWIQGG